jgi:tRNA-Thr(GGU) m(6)t(6)A37 methyltransferase TsaA
MKIECEPIGFVRTAVEKVPRHWTVSEAEGAIVVNEAYREGLKDIKAGQRIVVLFYFHESPRFTSEFLVQKPPHHNERLGVFSICSPIRPNPIGMSVVEVLSVEGFVIRIKGLDMRDGTPVLDIKPAVEREWEILGDHAELATGS